MFSAGGGDPPDDPGTWVGWGLATILIVVAGRAMLALFGGWRDQSRDAHHRSQLDLQRGDDCLKALAAEQALRAGLEVEVAHLRDDNEKLRDALRTSGWGEAPLRELTEGDD